MWNELLHSLKHSQYQIQIALPELVAPDLLGVLLQSQKRGVHLQWVMEEEKLAQSSTSVIIQSMRSRQAECWSTKKLDEYFIIVDQQSVWTSVFPWGGAYGKADPWAELSKIETPDLVQTFQFRWQRLLSEAKDSFGERPSFALYSDKPTLKTGDSCQLYWDAPMGSELIISPLVGSVPARGKRKVKIEQDTHFKLEANYHGKTYQSHCFVRCQQAPRVLFEADNKRCHVGENVRIWWHVDQSIGLEISLLGRVPNVGQHRFQVMEDTSITLLAIGARENISRTIHIHTK
ncbi:MAG: hypothetical protein AAFN10_06380 [Bacteroidota bacterium]